MAPPPSAGGQSHAGLSDGLAPSPSACSPAYRRPDWLLFNDFCIAPCASAEVLTLFGNQKVPCLLYYSRVSTLLLLQPPPPPQPPRAHHPLTYFPGNIPPSFKRAVQCGSHHSTVGSLAPGTMQKVSQARSINIPPGSFAQFLPAL